MENLGRIINDMENLGNIIVIAILVLIVAGVIFKMVRDRKKGKSSCGCDCGQCNNMCCKQVDNSQFGKKADNNPFSKKTDNNPFGELDSNSQ